MYIDKNITPFIIFSEESILNALQKISQNKNKIIFSVTESGIITGCLTDGDFRRWLLKEQEVDLNKPVSKILNINFTSTSINTNHSEIEQLLSKNSTPV